MHFHTLHRNLEWPAGLPLFTASDSLPRPGGKFIRIDRQRGRARPLTSNCTRRVIKDNWWCWKPKVSFVVFLPRSRRRWGCWSANGAFSGSVAKSLGESLHIIFLRTFKMIFSIKSNQMVSKKKPILQIHWCEWEFLFAYKPSLTRLHCLVKSKLFKFSKSEHYPTLILFFLNADSHLATTKSFRWLRNRTNPNELQSNALLSCARMAATGNERRPAVSKHMLQVFILELFWNAPKYLRARFFIITFYVVMIVKNWKSWKVKQQDQFNFFLVFLQIIFSRYLRWYY